MTQEQFNYRKKPVIIQAMRWDGTWDGLCEIHKALTGSENKVYLIETTNPECLMIESDGHGSIRAEAGDWIIRGVKGEFYPCKDDVFRQTYEVV